MELGNYVFGSSRGEYPVPRAWQDVFCEHLRIMGFDSYGFPREWDVGGVWHEELSEHLVTCMCDIRGSDGGTHRKFETDTFVIMPYYWGDDEDIQALPNFVYKPAKFAIQWYKYALRDSYMNQIVTLDQLEDMLHQCRKSLSREVFTQ